MHTVYFRLAIFVGLVLTVGASTTFGAHEIYLRDNNGTPVAVGSATPYSPKQTCGTVGCHIDMVKGFGFDSSSIYEYGRLDTAKDSSGLGFVAAGPRHGVSAGYHLQTGNSSLWGALQRSVYKLPEFTSSPGMFGGFLGRSGARLAHPSAANPAGLTMTAYEFSRADCAWCHAGGGPLEYDRAGFRYDGLAGLFAPGPNPAPGQGDYYRYDPASGALVSAVEDWQRGGVAETDCLLCHLPTPWNGMRYSMLERNAAFSSASSPGLAASLGLVGTPGAPGLLAIARTAGDGIAPDVDPAGWSWRANQVDVAVVPNKENCALCHMTDGGLTARGPAGLPLGATVMQSIAPAGTAIDRDELPGTAGRDGKNDEVWRTARLRADAASRGASINDPGNPDVHMDRGKECSFCHYALGAARDYNYDCVTCHYDYWGYPAPPPVPAAVPQTYPAFVSSGAVIQPAIDVFRIDHQFAKGNNTTDGLVMDQLDDTVTCESCHVARTHPRAGAIGTPGAAPDPAAAHSGFPARHFLLIDCRTCHIPSVTFNSRQLVVDETSAPWRGGAREQTVAAGAGGAALLRMARTNSLTGAVRIEPVSIVTNARWIDASTKEPVAFRITAAAAAALQQQYGDQDQDGLFDWPFNRPQGGDEALIVNRPAELTGMVAALRARGVVDPVMELAPTPYELSHNVASKAQGVILGSPAGGGCVMCHGNMDATSQNYSPRAVGFFDGSTPLFREPIDADGGANGGIIQTVESGVRRVTVPVTSVRPDGTASALDLAAVAEGAAIPALLKQSALLGLTDMELAKLTNPATAGVPQPTAAFTYAKAGLTVTVNSATAICPSTTCSFTWDFGDGSGGTGASTAHTYRDPGTYQVKLTVDDLGYFTRNATSISLSVAAENQAPRADFTSDLVSYGTPTFFTSHTWTVNLLDRSVDENPSDLTIAVAWGDGSVQDVKTGVGSAFSHRYAAAGSYTITYRVTDAGGLSDARSTPIKLIAYRVSGRVTTSAGTGVAAAKVELRQGSTVVKTAYTDSLGAFSLSLVKPGVYTVVAAKTGLSFPEQSVTTGPDQVVNVTAQ